MTLAPDFGILAQAYRMPFRFPMTAVRIFWPFMLVYELGSQAMAHSANATILRPTFLIFLVIGYFVLLPTALLIFLPGAVRWHRWLVLDEPVTMISLRWDSRTRAYFWRALVLTLFGILTTAILFIPYLVVQTLAIEPEGAATSVLTASEPSLWLFPLFATLTDLAVVIFLSKFVLQLPHCAVGLVTRDAAPPQLDHLRPAAGWRLTLLLATLPLTMLATLPAIVFPELTADAATRPDGTLPAQVLAMTTVSAVLQDLLYFYAALVFLSTLSLWYARHERPRIPSEINVGQ